MTARPALILVAGGPGAGKTSLGRELARRLQSAVLLDKDVIASPWVDAMLDRLNNGQVDRDSAVYWETVRPLEYRALLAAALDNLAIGKSVVAVAPFGPELRDPGWIEARRQSLSASGARLAIVWIATDSPVAHERMVARNDARDRWKLAHWHEFTASDRFSAAPGVDLVLHNGAGSRIGDLVDRVIEHLNT